MGNEDNAALKIQTAFRNKQARAESGGSSAVTVGLRMRPFVPHELKRGQPKACISISNNVMKVVSGALVDQTHANEGPWKFDMIMDSSDATDPSFVDNAKCYDLMGKRMVDDVLQGFNTCLFCYGQTGTGKTTTIMGDEINGPGLLRRLLDDIFLEAGKFREQGAKVAIEIQMLEVYNEELHDLLLEPGAAKTHLQVHVLPGGAVVKGATSKDVVSAEDCQKEIDLGNSRRTVAATQMNPQSSRGHTVFKLVFKMSGSPDGKKLSSEVYFADLAGHENIKTTAVTGDRLKELTFINGSLMWLQNALHSMAEAAGKKKGPDFGKFRNSKLTLLLSNALTGNSKTAVIVTLSPSVEHFDTSLSSIKFAYEVKGIKVKAVSTAGQDPQSIIARLEAENKSLKERLAGSSAKADPAEATGANEKAAIEGLRDQLQSEAAEAHKLREEAAELRTQKQALQDELTSLKMQLSAVEQSMGQERPAPRDGGDAKQDLAPRKSIPEYGSGATFEVSKGTAIHGNTIDQLQKVLELSKKNVELFQDLVRKQGGPP